MASRVGLLVALVVVTAVAVASAPARQPQTRSAIYVVRADKRLCPSPLCGGYWVAVANSARTRCANGLRYPQCYVARAVGVAGSTARRHPGRSTRPRSSWTWDATTSVSSPCPQCSLLPARRDRSRRLLPPRRQRHPLRSRAVLLDASVAPQPPVRDDDLGARAEHLAERREAGEARSSRALATRNGVLARGRIASTPDGGRVFYASRFYLRAP